MISSDILFGSEIALLVGFSSAGIILVLTATFGLDSAKDLRSIKKVMAAQSTLIPDVQKTHQPLEGSREEIKFSHTEAQFHVLFAGFTALFVSLFVGVLLCSFSEHLALVWRLSAALTALLHFNGTIRIILATQRSQKVSPIRVGMIATGLGIAIVNTVTTLGLWSVMAPFFVLFGIFWTLVVSSISFMTLFAEMGSE
ncbi:unannotated protein [freshwater metagenome]|uniref:Unannotated protein n=1 Tax=freshwater metagenome TaxID=449393 RepID=A0A6J7BIP5_9ZZZZ|nr:hypothetical protein [Actinomycetota bacterium]